MVSSSLLVGLVSVVGLIHGLPLRSADDLTRGSSNFLTSRSPEPRFKNPFDVADFLKKVDTKIPDNQDIQNWIDQAETKGAMGGDDDSDNDDDDIDDDNGDHHNHDDDDDDDDDNRKHGYQDYPKKGKMAKPSPSVSLPQSTSTGSESVNVIASSIPSPSSNVESQTTTVYVPATVLPSLNRGETPASSPTVFSFPSTTPMSAKPTSAPIMYKIIPA